MDGNNPFIDTGNTLSFFMFLAMGALIYKSFKKNIFLGVISSSGVGLGLFYFFTNPIAEKYITTFFATFLLIGLGFWLWEKRLTL